VLDVGEAVGSLVGITEVGLTDGSFVGLMVGIQDGSEVLRREGTVVGLAVGSAVGLGELDGSAVGIRLEGTPEGDALVACVDGKKLGNFDGNLDGFNETRGVGDAVRSRDGDRVVVSRGALEGLTVGD